MRRVLLLLLLLALTAIGTWQLFRQMRPAESSTDPWSAIPSDAALIIALPDVRSFWEQWTRTAQLATVFGGTATGQAFDRVFSRLVGNEADGSAHVPLILAVVRRDDGSAASCAVLSSMTPDALAGIAAHVGAGLGRAALERGERIRLQVDTGLPDLHGTLHKDLLLLSSDPALLEDMVRKTGMAATNNGLTQARRTLGLGADAYVMVHLAEAWPGLEQWVDPNALGELPCSDGWAALDVRIRPEALLMSGVFLAADSTGAAKNASPFTQEDMLRALPAEVTVLDLHGPEFLARRIVDHAPDSVRSLLSEWSGMASATGSGYIAEDSLAHWLVVAAIDTASTARVLASLQATGTSALKHRGYPIHHAPALRVLADSTWTPALEWVVLLGDHVVIADLSSAAVRAVDAYLDGGTLAQDLRTSELLQRNASPALRTIWCDLGRGQVQLARSATSSAAATMATQADLWNELGGLLFQVRRREKGMSYIHLSVQHAPISQPVDRTRWSLPLTAPLIGVPQMVRNHANGMSEILVQDSTTRLLLISTGGHVLWEKKLEGPMCAPALQVDRFRNGKLQLLIGTRQNIHLIDRNGADVAGFPVRLAAEASAPLSVVDYEKDGHYRILVPLEDGRLLNLGPDGKPVEGWTPEKLAVPINSPVQHLRIKGKDHLLFSDANGRIHVLDRRGAKRMAKGPELSKGSKLIAVVGGNDLATSQLIHINADGELRSTTLGGTTLKIGRAEQERFGTYSSGTGSRLWRLDGDSLWTRDPRDRVASASRYRGPA
ncbi:MAG: hypothetical protein IPK99_15640 [Flavobacteriales bacterium]|nr:hypothetical protein [Flavobacteriales bacterium]